MRIEIKGVSFDLSVAELAKLQNDIEVLTKGDEIALYVARVQAYAEALKFQAKIFEEKMKLFTLGPPPYPEYHTPPPDIDLPDFKFPDIELPDFK